MRLPFMPAAASMLMFAAVCAADEPVGGPPERLDLNDWQRDYQIASLHRDCSLQLNILRGALVSGFEGAANLLAGHYARGECVRPDQAEAARLQGLGGGRPQ